MQVSLGLGHAMIQILEADRNTAAILENTPEQFPPSRKRWLMKKSYKAAWGYSFSRAFCTSKAALSPASIAPST
jgi:hypothetical protein